MARVGTILFKVWPPLSPPQGRQETCSCEFMSALLLITYGLLPDEIYAFLRLTATYLLAVYIHIYIYLSSCFFL